MVDQGFFHSHRMQGLPSDEDLNSLPPSPHNLSQEGTLHEHPDLKVGSVTLLDHRVEGEVETLK